MTVRANEVLRRRLLLGGSAGALVLSAEMADAQGSMFRKTPRNPAEQAAAAAAQRATQNQTASTATRRTIEAFARASAIRPRMNAAQAAARAAAMAAASSVPNGLGQGGLQAANGVSTDPSLWIGANGPTQATGGDGRTKVEIGQTEAKAILTWDSFNVGRETDLTFNQKGNTDWVALNRITDPPATRGRRRCVGQCGYRRARALDERSVRSRRRMRRGARRWRHRPKPMTDIPTILNVRFIGFGEG